jgi:hypothetical protein
VGPDAPGSLRVIRRLDLAVLLLALPIFIAANLPLLGWAVGTAAYVGQLAIKLLVERKAKASDDPRTIVGLTAGSMIGRGWLVALSLFGVGLSNNRAGLCAAVLFLAAFTVYFSTSMVVRPFEMPPPGKPGKPGEKESGE